MISMDGSGDVLTASRSVMKYMRARKRGKLVNSPITMVMIMT